MIGLDLLVGATAGLVGLGAAERHRHRRNLRRIPIRVHVGGTRGKSSVTRLIAGGLRAAGRSVVAKTTGTLARTILPDGQELPVFRPAGPNIIEQKRVVAAAAAAGAEALVLECMALHPALHWASEALMVRATHAIITNARADHLDMMGPTEADVALCLAGMIPPGRVLYTAERRHLGILAAACRDRGARLVALDARAIAEVRDADLRGFAHTEHRENVALALALLGDLGCDRETALRGMWSAASDPGALTAHTLRFFGRRIVFVNAFAANDPESTTRIWELARARFPNEERTVAVFNLRADRPQRTQQLAGSTSFWHSAEGVVLMGGGAYLFSKLAARSGFDPGRFDFADERRADQVFERILGLCGASTLVIGMGNVGGEGLELAHYFRNRAGGPADSLGPMPPSLPAGAAAREPAPGPGEEP